MISTRRIARLAVAGSAAVLAATAAAQQQVVKPPIAQYWIDVATHSMAGMPEMPGMPSLPAFMGGGGAGAGNNHYGNARGMAPGRWVDLALHTRNKPSGTEATHAIPAGLQMGAGLPLMPLAARPAPDREPGEVTEDMREKPTGRLLIYWGCGEAVRSGQPRVIDLSGDPQAFGRAFAGRYAPDRGARVGPGYSIWPNEKNRTMVPRGASLAGSHAISGEGVPASMKFAIGPAQDFMPAIELAASGALADSIALQWPAVRNARAYFLHAMGSVGRDMVLWSSAETPDTGMGLFDYLSNATIDRWLADKALLPASTTRCAVPKGIFASASDAGAMLRMIAWGSELNLAHPPRPTDPRVAWEPDWSARVRVKATTMAMLGVEMPAAASGATAGEAAAQPGQAEPGQAAQDAAPSIPGLPGAGRAIDAIRGIFGR